MKAIFDDQQGQHDPKHFMANGKLLPNPEQPQRIDVLQAGALAAGCSFAAPADAGLGPIAAVHTAEYLTFLKNIYRRWQYIEGAGDEVIPNIHPAHRTDSYPKSATGQSGYHQADTACPIAQGTWEAAYWSAQSAISGADLLLGGTQSAYVLARPPGHKPQRRPPGSTSTPIPSMTDEELSFQKQQQKAILLEQRKQANLQRAIFG